MLIKKIKEYLLPGNMSLRTKITIAALVYTALMLAVLTSMILHLQKENYRSRAIQSARQIAAEFSQSLFHKWDTTAPLSDNKEKLSQYTMLSNMAFRDQNIVYVAFQDADDKIAYIVKSLPQYVWMMNLTKTDPYTERMLRVTGETTRSFASYPEGLVTEYLNVVYDKDKKFLGVIKIGISEKQVQESIIAITRNTLVKIITVNLGALLLIGIIVYYMSTKLETRLIGIQKQARKMLDRTPDHQNTQNVFSQLTNELQEIEGIITSLKQRFMELVITISHEFRSPMQAIKGYSEFIMKGGAGPVTDEQMKYLDNISENAERFQTFIDNVLDLVKLGGDSFPLAKRNFRVEEIILKTVSLYAKQIQKADIKIEVKIPTPELNTFGDPDRTFQVLVNLLSNAIKFTPENGTICIGAQREDNTVIFHVKDTGAGIPLSKQGKLFTEFYQVPGIKPERGYKGLGIGLALCKKLVEIQGGAIAVESSPDTGTVVFFTLPAQQEKPV
ncbi:MAG: HAMP domain-containing sensor histidine kinase [Elusimicrobiaceae bacterium]